MLDLGPRSSERERVLDDLNESQRSAAETVRGPLCILAGAGSGKTTTITRRIAYQVATSTFPPGQILAVTFTDRAAAEMRSRLKALGAGNVRARTFHAEALAQVSAMDESPPKLLSSKAQIVGPLVRRLPPPYKFRPTADAAGEIERAKNRRVAPALYLDDLGDHTPPLPPDIMLRLYREYESRKAKAGLIDFEDLLERAIELLESPANSERVRDRYRAFTVDEFQDVNLLQARLLEAWLGGRAELCVVGDDYQSIYGFTGASPERLLGFRDRHAGAKVVTLEDNYRSTPEVLEVANRLAGRLGGASKVLKPVLDSGPRATLTEHEDARAELDSIVSSVRRLVKTEGVSPEQVAILYRINARSQDYEMALSRAGLPVHVRDGAFLQRPGPRTVLARLSRLRPETNAADAVEDAAREIGWDPDASPEGRQEADRQADLSRLVAIAAEDPDVSVAEFISSVAARFASEAEGSRGVVLSTYHRAKGLEFEAVFLPRLEERELPFALSASDEEVTEERRLLYVGITRAKRHLALSWVRTRDGKKVRPSRFVRELLPEPARPARTASSGSNGSSKPDDPELFVRLKEWRRRAADEAGVPAYVVFHDATLREIVQTVPATMAELAAVAGVGPTKLARYGTQVLDVVQSANRP
ncbi:MAG TPA: ATP-dependent DNA helicase UvrD2 [Actinomycetota bacterium]|nr:ATP-dependent DNA helicase UvrD2 [Actinomycetota bacterium]